MIALYTDGTVDNYPKIKDFEDARKLIGGFIEPIQMASGEMTLLVDEDGRMKDLPLNLALGSEFGIRGTALLLESPEERKEILG